MSEHLQKVNSNKQKQTDINLDKQVISIRSDFADGIRKYLDSRKKADRAAGKKGKDVLSQDRLADEWNIAPATLSTWLNGTRFPDMDKLIAICDIIGYDIDGLLGRINSNSHDDEFIKNTTGLSDASLAYLKKINADKDIKEIMEEKISRPNNDKYLLQVINLIISDHSILMPIYNYLFNSSVSSVDVAGKIVGNKKDDYESRYYMQDVSRLFINDTSVDNSLLAEVRLKDIQKALDKLKEEGDPH